MRSESSFEIDGDLIFVEATVVGPKGRAAVRLLLDTGAFLTTLIPEIAETIGYTAKDGIRPTRVRTATADEPGYLVKLLEISVLGFSVPDVYANVADLGHDIDGVLGMNVLLDYNFEIRPAERRILVEKIAP